MTPQIGVHRSLSYEAYCAIDAVRSSHLKGFKRSARHAREQILGDTETAAKTLGQALHVALLEPNLFSKSYAAAPKVDRRTNIGKNTWAHFQADNAGKIPLLKEEYDECMALAEAAHGHPDAVELLSNEKAMREVTLVWQEANGLYGKARLDLLTTYRGYSAIVDIKTTRDASPKWFARDADTYSYQLQAAWYLRGADALQPIPRRYILLAIEKGKPHGVALYEFDEPFLADGRRQIEKALVAYKNATDSGVWPGYPLGIHTLQAPGWITPDADDTDE